MKKINIILASLFCLSISITACSLVGLDLQEDYDYKKSTLDPHINMTARAYLEKRGKNPVVANDTIFKWMQLGLEYAGIDLAEYEKPGRTYVFLSNGAIRVLPTTTTNGVVKTTSNIPTAGMWFTFPLMVKNPDGTLKTAGTPAVPVTALPTKWSDYDKEDVKNYFLSLIAEGDYGFDNGQTANTTLKTLLPEGAKATNKTRLGYYVAGTTPNYNLTGGRIFTIDYAAGGNGFDPESKINFKIVNGDYSPIQVNDYNTLTTSGIVATNGQIHVFAPTGAVTTAIYSFFPFRY
ncbi:MAG: hypothetical protein JWQ25_386 [Daejeonella sp.]|nr:hypothetical protein [Daejeonella sp.]